jgi:hypothetical protein
LYEEKRGRMQEGKEDRKKGKLGGKGSRGGGK